MYQFVFFIFRDVTDLSEGRYNVDVDTSESGEQYPSSPKVFWNDIKLK